MKKFRVFLSGRNFWWDFAGEGPKRMGWFTTRWVEAADREEAAKVAVEALRSEPKMVERFGILRNDPADPPVIVADEIEEVPSFDEADARQPGLAMYDDNAEDFPR